MTDHKFTDERIIRCLNECSGKENVVAHIVDQGEDELVTLGRILEIINRQKSEIEALTNAVDNSTKEFLSLHDAYQDQKAEIERLQKHNTEFARKHYSDGYNEAVKKFAERLKEYGHPIHSLVDKLVKEMTEENTHEMQSTDQP